MTTPIVTLTEAMANLRLLDVTEDEAEGIERMILAATEWSENYARRTWATTSRVEYLTTFPQSRSVAIVLPGGPVSSVTSITYYDSDDVQQTWDSAEYRVVTLKGRSYLYPAIGSEWPTDCGGEPLNIELTYSVGSAVADVPVAAKQAVLLLVGSMYEYREEGVIDNAGLAVVKAPVAAKQLLMPLKVAL